MLKLPKKGTKRNNNCFTLWYEAQETTIRHCPKIRRKINKYENERILHVGTIS